MGAMTAFKTVVGVAATGAAAPTLASDGIDVSNCMGVAVTVSCASGQTVTSGTLLGYAYVPVASNPDGSVATWRWVRFAAIDFTPTASQRDGVSGDLEPLVGVGRIAFVPALVVSSGTVDLTYAIRRRRG